MYQRQRHPDTEKHILTFVRGSGSVRVHLSTILRVQVWFRFTEVKFCWFRFGSGSPKWNGSFGFTVWVQVRFDTLIKTKFLVAKIANTRMLRILEKKLEPKARVSNRTWTRTVNPNEPFHFGEPNLNQQNFTSVNLNQIWTLKIVLKWTQTEPEPLTKVRIYFSVSWCRWRWYTPNTSSGDHQQDQQFLLFFSGTKRVTTVKF